MSNYAPWHHETDTRPVYWAGWKTGVCCGVVIMLIVGWIL